MVRQSQCASPALSVDDDVHEAMLVRTAIDAAMAIDDAEVRLVQFLENLKLRVSKRHRRPYDREDAKALEKKQRNRLAAQSNRDRKAQYRFRLDSAITQLEDILFARGEASSLAAPMQLDATLLSLTESLASPSFASLPSVPSTMLPSSGVPSSPSSSSESAAAAADDSDAASASVAAAAAAASASSPIALDQNLAQSEECLHASQTPPLPSVIPRTALFCVWMLCYLVQAYPALKPLLAYTQKTLTQPSPQSSAASAAASMTTSPSQTTSPSTTTPALSQFSTLSTPPPLPDVPLPPDVLAQFQAFYISHQQNPQSLSTRPRIPSVMKTETPVQSLPWAQNLQPPVMV